jgi:hypothetical protein
MRSASYANRSDAAQQPPRDVRRLASRVAVASPIPMLRQ